MAESSASNVGTSWWARQAPSLKTVFRVVLGLVWVINGALKFTSGYVDNFLGDVQNSQSNAPGWLSGWYSFWTNQATTNGTLIVYTVGVLELVLGLALLFGFLRKIAYLGGAVLSMLIWAVPEGFGAPYGPGTGSTDIGTGAVYALAFFGLIVINATYGASRWSLDYYIERAFPSWAKLAEFGSGPPTAAPRVATGSETPG